MTRLSGIFYACLFVLQGFAQGDQQLRAQADDLFSKQQFAEATSMYAQLVSLNPSDRDLNYKLGTCIIHSGDDKEKAVGFLKFASEDPSVSPMSWFYLGRAYHLTYRFKEALNAYQRFRGVGDKKALASLPMDALEDQCRNGLGLLDNIRDVQVHNKVEVADREFFRFYELEGIGGRIVVTPEELMTSLDKKNGQRSLVYLPEVPGPFYYSSYGKDGRSGLDIYRTELRPDGTFESPVKLSGYINTDQDEAYAFLHPDGKTFYFSSKGHNSMGGYDVFKCNYDKGLDVFGPPENMDFAVNTPDDDIFYIVDASGTEACFASGRDSKQGMIHVYRVGTSQVPVTITVIKGTFSNGFDVNDRAAHITVEDALNREVVADVRTDINGTYLIALPRMGRYRFLVEAGPSGKTHAGMVEIPRSDSPRAYRQEMSLLDQGGQEKLMIKNYFDEPLDDDVMALAMDEIRRRAKLDVNATARQEVAQQPEVPNDALTEAGFTGEMTKQGAIDLAAAYAAEDAGKVEDLQERSGQSFAIALSATAEAEQATQRAEGLVRQTEATTDDAERNELMIDAARERRKARQATLRARAAYAAGRDLNTESLAARQQAAESTKLAQDLKASIQGNDANAGLEHLRTLRAEQLDRNGPAGSVSVEEKYRRASSEQEREAAQAMSKATSLRNEENELTDRVRRLTAERDATKSKGRKEELDKEISGYEEQLGHLRDEVAREQAKARVIQEGTSVAKAEAELMAFLATEGKGSTAAELDQQQVSALGQRIAGTGIRAESIAIDERYEAAVAEEMAGRPLNTFDWSMDASTALAQPDRTGTQAMARNSDLDAARMQGRTTDAQPDLAAATPVQGDLSNTTNGLADPDGEQENTADGIPIGTSGNVSRGDSDLVSAEGAVPIGSLDPEFEGAEATAEDRFLLENELAELTQLRTASRDRAEQERLDTRIADVQGRMERLDAAEATRIANDQAAVDAIATEALQATGPSGGTALMFDPATPEAELLERIDPGYTVDKARIRTIADQQERAAGMQGLELMLVDSIQAETQRQLTVLENEPARAEEILPRVDRLRQLKQVHMQEAERQLLISRGQAEPTATDLLLASGGTPAQGPLSTAPAPVGEQASVARTRSVEVEENPAQVYASRLIDRSPEVAEAVVERDRDLAAMEDLTVQIDSLEDLLSDQLGGREYDKVRKQADRLIDDRLILATDLGQRMEFITREEFQLAKDSLQGLSREVALLGLAPNEPLLLVTQRYKEDAEARAAEGRAFRKKAERTEDILLRDSLYRSAYRAELTALQEMDKAITISSYVLSDNFDRGASPTYAEIENSLFGAPPAAPTEFASATPEASGEAPNGVVDPGSTIIPAAVPPIEYRPELDRFMENDSEDAALMISEGEDPAMLRSDMEQALQNSRELERRSLEMADRAMEVRDSAAVAKRKDRESLTAASVRFQYESDSLHAASVLESERAYALEQRQRDAEERRALASRLAQYYYLSGEDQSMVLDNPDLSQYFQARSLALEQLDQANEARNEADASRELSNALLTEAAEVMSTGGTGRQPNATELASAAELNDRAVQLKLRADSLERVAARKAGAAGLNDGQAAAMLQSMEESRSSEIMALEMRSRRTEPMLAIARSGAAPQPSSNTAVPQPEPEQEVIAQVPQAARVEPEVPADPVPAAPIVPSAPAPSAPLAADVFYMDPNARPRTTAIPIDAPMPSGLVFKVQIGAFRNAVPQELFSDMTPVVGETTSSGLVRYTAGMFTSFQNADQAKGQVQERGYRDAFVVAYLDGKRIPIGQARAQVQQVPVAATIPAPQVRTPVVEVPATPSEPVTIARPTQVPGATVVPAQPEVLAGYPSTAEEVLAGFVPAPTAADYYNEPGAAPAKQVETVKGLFFTVQVGVYSKPVALDKLFDLSPLNSELTETRKIRYTTGIHRDLDSARNRKDAAVGKGVRDAFITAYLNGKRIPMSEAQALLNKHGSAILVAPELVTP